MCHHRGIGDCGETVDSNRFLEREKRPICFLSPRAATKLVETIDLRKLGGRETKEN